MDDGWDDDAARAPAPVQELNRAGIDSESRDALAKTGSAA